MCCQIKAYKITIHVFNSFFLALGIVGFVAFFIKVPGGHLTAGSISLIIGLILIGTFCFGLFAIVQEDSQLLIIYVGILAGIALLCLLVALITCFQINYKEEAYYEDGKENRVTSKRSLNLSTSWQLFQLMLIIPQIIIVVFLILALKGVNIVDGDNKN